MLNTINGVKTMRFSEFESEAKHIQFVKFTFEKTLVALIADYDKRLKLYKSMQKTARNKLKNKRTKAHKKTSALSLNLASRPKRKNQQLK